MYAQVAEGFLDFLDWFDDRGWYPLGRTIGGTIYPGLMATAACFYWVLQALHITINIRNVCVFLAPLFAANTAIASYLLTTEVKLELNILAPLKSILFVAFGAASTRCKHSC
jgi:dolichyl-diphosphooligosaccharide---protein glycosyltransferase